LPGLARLYFSFIYENAHLFYLGNWLGLAVVAPAALLGTLELMHNWHKMRFPRSMATGRCTSIFSETLPGSMW